MGGSPGSPQLSSTREIEKSAERSKRSAGQGEEEPSAVPNPPDEDPLPPGSPAVDHHALDPLMPGTVIQGEGTNLLQLPLTPRRMIRDGVAGLEASMQSGGDFLVSQAHCDHIVFAVSNLKLS